MLIPIGLDQSEVKRLPWISILIIGLNLVLFLTVGLSGSGAEKRAAEALAQVAEYWVAHPHLEFPNEMLQGQKLSERGKEELEALIEVRRSITPTPDSFIQRQEEQEELNRLVQVWKNAIESHPFMRWGFRPGHFSLVALITSMFMHAGLMHLIGNMFIFYLSGPFVEDAFGRPLFTVFYLFSGVAAVLAFMLTNKNATTVLVGASGAIAGVMGAFMVRYATRKIKFFYWFGLVFRGTFMAPAWLMLPLWLLQQVWMGSLDTESGVAYSAHVGGFAFGAICALFIKQLKVEERYIAPAIDKQISVSQHVGVMDGMDLLSKGMTDQAREALRGALADDPRNADANLGMWQTFVADARPGDGVEFLARVIEEELKRNELQLALEHWRELVASAGVGGPASLRWRLQALLEATSPDATIEILFNLAADPSAGLLAEKAARRLTAMGHEVPSQVAPGPVVPASSPPPAVPAATPLQARSASDGRGSEVYEPSAFEEPAPAPPPSHEPASFGANAEVAQDIVFSSAAPPSGWEVEECVLDRLDEDGVTLHSGFGGSEFLPFGEITQVAIAGIAAQPRPYLVLDVILGRTANGNKVVRFPSTSFDPRAVLGKPDMGAMEAFRYLVLAIAQGAGAQVLPPGVFAAGGKIPTFPDAGTYQVAILDPLRREA
jgi:membrane associated rhomboid family serine protease